MNIFCMKTCNLCEPEDGPTMPPVSCEDTNQACYLQPGLCQADWMEGYIEDPEDAKKNMEKLCPKTCNLCE